MAISFNQFIDFLNENLGDNTSRAGVNHVFEKLADRKMGEITPESLHKIIAEIEADSKLSLKDIKYMMQRISEPSKDVNITSDEFYYIMTKRPMDVDLITPVTKVTK
jgi:Ca2+-binding EF-hand superfamily protein